MYSLKAQKDTNGEAMSACKVGAKAGGPPFIWAGVGDGPMYHQNINKSLKTNNKYFELIIKNLHTALLMRVIRLLFVFAFFPFLHAETVVCSFSILQNLCAQLCQGIDSIQVYTIVPKSVDPHMYQPKPSDSKTLAKADLVITNGLNLEGWITNLIDGSGYKGKVVMASENISARYLGKLPDPHVWHSPKLINLMINNITNALKDAFPNHTSTFEKNAISLKATFNELQTNVAELFAKIPQSKRVMLTTHDAFSYFAQCYNVVVLSPQGVSTSDDPSAADMKNLIGQIRSLQISAIFLENLSNPKILNAIANETGKKVSGVLYADTLKDDLNLQDTLWYNATVIAGAMNA
jgi:zinc/manganese transport system substrate-binding protein